MINRGRQFSYAALCALITASSAYGWRRSGTPVYAEGQTGAITTRRSGRFGIDRHHASARTTDYPRYSVSVGTAYAARGGRGETWNDVVSRARSPKDICGAVRRRVKAQRDAPGHDEWRGGWQTWTERRGDCEDYAACVEELCIERGFSAQTVVFADKSRKKGHAVVIGQWNGRMWMSSNGCYEEVASIDDAKARVAHSLGWEIGNVELMKPRES